MPACARPACSRRLDSSQTSRGAAYCSTACRAAAFRERRRAAIVAALDLVDTEIHAATVAALVGDEEASLSALHDLALAVDSVRDNVR